MRGGPEVQSATRPAGTVAPRLRGALTAGTVRVPRKLAALRNRMEFGPPKSDAGVRVVALPAAAVVALCLHLLAHVDPESEALVFTGAKGAVLRSGNFRHARALIYQHATSERDREIAAGMDRRISGRAGGKAKGKRRRKKSDDGDDGAAGELARVS